MFVTTTCGQVSVYAPSELIDQTEYALSVATTVLDFYEKYYGIRYPLSKSGKRAMKATHCNVEIFGLSNYIVLRFFDPTATNVVFLALLVRFLVVVRFSKY